MATKDTTIDGSGISWGAHISPGMLIPSNIKMYPTDEKEGFRKSFNEIEGKEWFELDVSKADTIVIIHDGKSVEMDKKDFLQKVGLEW